MGFSLFVPSQFFCYAVVTYYWFIAANFVRNVIACVLSFVVDPLVLAVGSGYVGLMMATMSIVAASGVVGHIWLHTSYVMWGCA